MVNSGENITNVPEEKNNFSKTDKKNKDMVENTVNEHVENTGNTNHTGLTPDELLPNQNETKDKKKGRKHKKYKVSINHTALKELEGTTASSFLDLAKAVILIDGKPYDKDYITLSKERKNDFKRYIEHYAVMDAIGKRKYHIKRVYSLKQREELNEQAVNIGRDNAKK